MASLRSASEAWRAALIVSKASEEGKASGKRMRVFSVNRERLVTVLERHGESKGVKINGMKSQKLFEMRRETGDYDKFLKGKTEDGGVGRCKLRRM